MTIPARLRDITTPALLEKWEQDALNRSEGAKRTFLMATERESIKSEWREVDGPLDRQTELQVRYCDLVITGQADPEEVHIGTRDLTSELVLMAGRPIITVPYVGKFETVGKRVLVAWDGTREATRAVHDAIPILTTAEVVSVCEVNPPDSAHSTALDIAAHLVEHGVNAEAHPTVSKLPKDETAVLGARSLRVGDVLLSAASDFSADLLVMGAYGHSRIREFVLGGTTRYMLEHMTVPVLMAH